MDPEASSSRSSSDSFTTGSTSRSTSNPEDEGRSRPPDEVPKLVSAEQHQSESTESGIEDEATFPVAHPASDDYNGSVFHAFSVDNSYKALKPIHVEGANNGVLFENRSSSSEGDDSVVEVSNNVLVDLDGIELPSPNAMSNSPSEPFVRVEQVHEVQPAFYSDICQENERILRKAASVAKNPNMAEYLLWKNQTIDNELCNVEQQQKQRNDELQLQLHFKGKEVESLRYELDETKRENKVLRRMLEWEIRKGVIEMDTKNHEKACLRMKQPKLRKLNDPREQLAKTEQQFESCQQQIRKLKDENAELHARNAVNEAEVVKLEKEKTAAIDRITEKEEELQVLVSTFYRLIEERFEYVHLQLCCVSKTYALHYPKARTVSLAAALHLEASSLSPNTASSSVRPSMKGRPESSSMPVGADVVAPFPCPDQNLSSASGFELCRTEESLTKRSSGLELKFYSMESEIPPHDLVSLASYFDSVELLVDLLRLSPADKSDVKAKAHTHNTQTAVHYGFLCWRKGKPEEVTFQALVDIARKLTREDIVRNIGEYFNKNY